MTEGLGAHPQGGDFARRLAVAAAAAASEKKGEHTVVLEVGPILAITDFFVITSATNTRQVRTITEEVQLALKRAGSIRPNKVEGLDDARWVLMDYGDFVVHVFLDEARSYYQLERLWADAPVLEFEAELARAQGPGRQNMPG